MSKYSTDPLRLGIDIGSTTVKIIVLDASDHRVLFSKYQRHHAEQAKTVRRLLLRFIVPLPQICSCGVRQCFSRTMITLW